MQLNVTDIIPRQEAVLQHQGIPKTGPAAKRFADLLTDALDIFRSSAKPAGLIKEISITEFRTVFRGSGKNDPNAPLQNIFPRAEHLALFAITIGREISEKIEDSFNKSDFALGAMLDSAASVAAENGVELYEQYFQNKFRDEKNSSQNFRVLGYSPGYCGWHISGQEKLFQFIRPDKIGISLNESYLMSPLKSVTGVLVAGKKEIHIFKSNFSFCALCKHHSCRERMVKL